MRERTEREKLIEVTNQLEETIRHLRLCRDELLDLRPDQARNIHDIGKQLNGELTDLVISTPPATDPNRELRPLSKAPSNVPYRPSIDR